VPAGSGPGKDSVGTTALCESQWRGAASIRIYGLGVGLTVQPGPGWEPHAGSQSLQRPS